jgi:hypothetical protein
MASTFNCKKHRIAFKPIYEKSNTYYQPMLDESPSEIIMDRRNFIIASTAIAGMAASASQSKATGPDDSLLEIASPHLTISPKTSDQWEIAFKPKRPLRVLQVTDTHFSSTEDKDQLTIKTLNALIRSTRPDLIVHTGDFVNNDSQEPVSWAGVNYFNQLEIPWTLCFGNHDYPVANAKGSLSLEDYRKSLKNCAMGFADIDQKTHYCYRHDLQGQRTEPTVSLFYFQVGYAEGERKISDPQLVWLDQQLQEDKAKGWDCPILVFVHIPLLQYESMAASGKSLGGFKNEKVCFDSDTGNTFQVFAKSQRVKGVFCGHDHVNNYFGTWEDIDLHYGRVSGWGGYGQWARGGRLISIDPNNGRFTHREVLI